MYQWNTLRTLAGLLLCIPLIHVALMVSRDISTYLDPSPEVWDGEISALITSDLDAVIPNEPVVVIGGHRVRLWKDLAVSLLPKATLLRPLGDATLEDLIHHYDRLAAFYRPDILVVFPGYADLHLRDEKTPSDFKNSLRALLDLDEEYGASSWRYVIAPVQMPLHPEDRERISLISKTIKPLEEELPDLTIIDPNPILSRMDGTPNPAYYRGDGVNLSPSGYERISLLLATEIKTRQEREHLKTASQ
ncbi:hypothetical protein R0135_15515 [Congregibacter variabilis]|uniref:SGNH hydrolase-type esterase domain-containing protein n=1 Tax=Congregibacter variabilis TaxID=3081200 RepID=A0ABZ0I1X5_9GAMM|nr:hypothetical protein R0135_15515 [Congregibacter sp. IMCC43200]